MQVAVFTATLDESRLVALIDGSKVLLSPGSELGVDIDGNGRRLELRRGEGRFTVAHEAPYESSGSMMICVEPVRPNTSSCRSRPGLISTEERSQYRSRPPIRSAITPSRSTVTQARSWTWGVRRSPLGKRPSVTVAPGTISVVDH